MAFVFEILEDFSCANSKNFLTIFDQSILLLPFFELCFYILLFPGE